MTVENIFLFMAKGIVLLFLYGGFALIVMSIIEGIFLPFECEFFKDFIAGWVTLTLCFLFLSILKQIDNL